MIPRRARSRARLRPAAAPCLLAALACAPPALASREGAGVAEAVALLFFLGIAAIVLFMAGGAAYGGYKAAQQGESVARGVGRGVLKGLRALLIAGIVGWGVLMVLGGVFFVYVMLTTSGR